VLRRLNLLRDELKRDPLDIPAANGALKAAVGRIVVNPEAASIELHWRDSDASTYVPFFSRFSKAFDDQENSQEPAAPG
jgi:hypothetical protein